MSNGTPYLSKGPEVLIDLVDQAAKILKSQGGLSPEKAEDLAVAIADRMAMMWGGNQIWFPKGNWNGGALRCFQLEQRDWNIYREYNGTNRKEMCARYDIGQARLYQIIAACRRHLATTNKPPLTTPSPPAKAGV